MMFLPRRHTKEHEGAKERQRNEMFYRARILSFPLSLVLSVLLRVALCAFVGEIAFAQISTDVIEKYRAALQKQSTDPEQKRAGGTQSHDWLFALPDGVTSKQITFYSDGARCYGRIFFPKGFQPRGKTPAVVVGHGINAQAVGIEKYAARFAERGLVAMAIDYRTYGYSSGDVLLLEPDTTNDTRAVWEKDARIQIKRTNLNNFRETEDFRAAISYIQAEPGVDPDRIGIWGSSNGASVVLMVAALDARVKAVVAQVGAASGLGATGPAAISPQMLEDGIKRARTGQGAEVDGGFSFKSKVDMFSSQINREFRPAMWLDRIPETTKILWLPVEKDELIPSRSVQLASKAFKGTSQVIEIPYLTHFQAYSYAGFEVGSSLAAEWFLKYLPSSGNSTASGSEPRGSETIRTGGKLATARGTVPADVTAKEIKFYSEGIQCYGKLFTPQGFSADSKTPAVVLAPDWRQTAEDIEGFAVRLAERGLAAMTIDYRGWGKSGGFLQTVNEVKSDDRLRFSQMTTKVRISRKRILPQQQVLDIRNALYFLQGEPGIDRTRVGVWGAGLAGDLALTIAATDARIKAAVAQMPTLSGDDAPPKAFAPTSALLLAEQRRARTGQITAAAETGLAMMDFHPRAYIEQIPEKTAVLLVTAQEAPRPQIAALAKRLKAPSKVAEVPLGALSEAAIDWFVQRL